MLGRLFGRFYLWAYRWKLENQPPLGLEKAVVVCAPHTSSSDFWPSRAVFLRLGIPVRFMVKQEFVPKWLHPVVRSFGAILVDRSSTNDLVTVVAGDMRRLKRVYLLIAPEGTRDRADRWKTGFYHIAKAAKLPILLAYLDYGKRTVGFGPLLTLTDQVTDFNQIYDYYCGITPKYPNRFRLPAVPPKSES